MIGREDRLFEMYRDALTDYKAQPSAAVYSNVQQVLGKKGFFHFTFTSFNAYYLGAILAAGALAYGVSQQGKTEALALNANAENLTLANVLPVQQPCEAKTEEANSEVISVETFEKAAPQTIVYAAKSKSALKAPKAGNAPANSGEKPKLSTAAQPNLASSETTDARTSVANSTESTGEIALLEVKTPQLPTQADLPAAAIANGDKFVQQITGNADKIVLKVKVPATGSDKK